MRAMTDTTPAVTLAANGDVAVLDVRQHSSATLHLKGGAVAAVGVTVLLEASNVENPGATDWFTVVGAASGSVTGATSSPMAAAGLAVDTPLGSSYRMNTAGYTYVRARRSAGTSGEVVARWSRGNAPVEPVPNAPAPATTVTANPPGGTKVALLTAATTNRTLVIGAAGNLDVLAISNPTATPAFLKVYDKATAPVAGDTGSGVLIATIPIPANSFQAIPFPNAGLRFSNGLGFAVTANAADNDDTATVAGIRIVGTRR